jgi:hypothetical protein
MGAEDINQIYFCELYQFKRREFLLFAPQFVG